MSRNQEAIKRAIAVLELVRSETKRPSSDIWWKLRVQEAIALLREVEESINESDNG